MKGKRIHFIGIGGSGMSGIAKLMAARGAAVTGSDLHDSTLLESLRTQGIAVTIGHSAELVAGVELVVRSSAIPESNPELTHARELRLPILERAEALAQLLDGKCAIAIAGTHGKTTTTSMLTVALQHCGFDPSFVIGATIRNSGTNAHQGSGEIFVVEADESDGSFTHYRPESAIITNIELDHVDNFKDLESIDQLFDDFVATVKENLVLCSDDSGVQRLLARKQRADLKVLGYGTTGDPDLLVDRIALSARGASARLTLRGRVLGELKLSIPGRHNLLNAAGALLVALEYGAPAQELMAGLTLFTGARRRFEIKGEVGGVAVIDDYGHHPTEIEATIATARTFAGTGRVFVIFQPHRFSRTQVFAAQFAGALAAADHTFLLEVYAASEAPIPGVSSAVIASRMTTPVTYEPSMPATITSIVTMVKPGDVVLTMGAGDVSALAPLILENLTAR
jgi:UDP-N-acetylmuramate--alanine ligase